MQEPGPEGSVPGSSERQRPSTGTDNDSQVSQMGLRLATEWMGGDSVVTRCYGAGEDIAHCSVGLDKLRSGEATW